MYKRKLAIALALFVLILTSAMLVVRSRRSAASVYDRQFFAHAQSRSARSASKVVPVVLQLVPAKSVIDVGCGTGDWLGEFQKRGVTDLLGVDGDYVDRTMLAIPRDRFLPRDLLNSLSLDRSFDLAVALEVAEHLPESRAEGFVHDLVKLAPAVLFSAAIPFQGGTAHINERWPDYWAAKFRKFDYVALDCLRLPLWNDAEIEWYYRQNMILYARRDYVESHPQLKQLFAQQPREMYRLVHPENASYPYLGLKPVLRLFPQAILTAIKDKLSR